MLLYLVGVVVLLMVVFARPQGPARRGRSPAYPMDIKEALEVLGLGEGVTAAEIVRVHKKLMKKNHPDHGGSDYLAQKINEAKDTLLKGQ